MLAKRIRLRGVRFYRLIVHSLVLICRDLYGEVTKSKIK